MVSRNPPSLAVILVLSAAEPLLAADGGAPAGVAAPANRIAELSRSLEQQAHELFLALSGRAAAGESLLLHAHNFMGAARSFSHLAVESPRDAELLRLSFSLLRRESELLLPQLPEESRDGAFGSISVTLRDLDALLLGIEGTAAEEDPERPRVTLESDGWHGNLLDRFIRVKGTLEGVDLERCDVVITDAKNGVAWSGEDVLREIEAHYRARAWQREETAKIRFSIRLPADRFAEGPNFITFTLTDGDGRQAVDTIAVGK
jgi:hypothetical protein